MSLDTKNWYKALIALPVTIGVSTDITKTVLHRCIVSLQYEYRQVALFLLLASSIITLSCLN